MLSKESALFCHFATFGITLISYCAVVKIFKYLFVLTTVCHHDLLKYPTSTCFWSTIGKIKSSMFLKIVTVPSLILIAMEAHETYCPLCPIYLPHRCCMFLSIWKQNHPQHEIERQEQEMTQPNSTWKAKNSNTVIPSFATFDRVPLSHFLCLSVNSEEDRAMHYIQSCW